MRLDKIAETLGRRRWRLRCPIAVAACAGWWLAGCGPAPPPPSFILVSVDAARADHVGAYGYERDTTPFLDALARRGFLFEQAIAPSLNTVVSHASLLTGLPAWAHGATYGKGGRALHSSFTSVAEELAENGYETAAFAAHGDWLTEEMGFAQGFATFSSDYRSAEAVLGEAAAWLTALPPEAPFFLFLHLYDVHSDYHGRPYEAPEPFRGRWASPGWDEETKGGSEYLAAINDGEREIAADEVALLRDQYDEGLAYTDDQLRGFFESIAVAQLERAWTLVVADHGEAFLEHGKLMHVTLHDEVARVPFILVPPPGSRHAGRAPARISRQVRLVDVRPTLLSLAGLPSPEDCMGVDLRPCLPGPEAGRCPSPPATLYRGGLRHDGYKLIRTPSGSLLYDLEQDPGELVNLAGRPDAWARQRGMQRLLGRLIEEQEALRERVVAGAELEPPAPDPETEERLRALGYLD